MNKLSALDAYKISVILEGVSKWPVELLESWEAVFPWHAQVKHGRWDGWDDVSRDHTCDGATTYTWEGVCAPCYPAFRAEGTLQQAQASGDPRRDLGKAKSWMTKNRLLLSNSRSQQGRCADNYRTTLMLMATRRRSRRINTIWSTSLSSWTLSSET